MLNDKMQEIDRVKLGHWPRNQNTVLLIIIAFIIGCIYLTHSIFQVLE